MKYKMELIFICLIICLFSLSSLCASDVNKTVLTNGNQSDNIIKIDNQNDIDYELNKDNSDSLDDNQRFEILKKNSFNETKIDSKEQNEDKIASDESEDKLEDIHSDDNIVIAIVSNGYEETPFVEIEFYKNMSGTLNVYVDGSLKFSKEISSKESLFLFPKDYNITLGTHRVKVTFLSYSFEDTYYLTKPKPASEEIPDNFDDLNNVITQSNGKLSLFKDYENNHGLEGESYNSIIKIKKNLIIYGNGHYIDAKGYGRIFYINKNFNVTLINITFKNGRHNYGGTLYTEGSNVTFINCTFVNTGDIYIENSDLDVESCYFKDSTGVLGNNVKSSILTSNIFTFSEGGTSSIIINLAGSNICVDNCSFRNGIFNNCWGTGIKLWGKNNVIKNCEFNATSLNQIMSISGNNGSVINCTFIGNCNCISVINSQFYTIENCYFKNNTGILVGYDGQNYDVTLLNSTFEENFREDVSYIIKWNCKSGKIVSCKFLENLTFKELFYNETNINLINNTGFGKPTYITVDRTNLYYTDILSIYFKESNGKKLFPKTLFIDIGLNHYEIITTSSPKYYPSISFDISDISVGDYQLDIYFLGDEEYEPSSLHESLTVKQKRDSYINITEKIISYQPEIIVQPKLYGENATIEYGKMYYRNISLSQRNIIVSCNNKNYSILNNEKLYINLKPGVYEIITYFEGDDVFAASKKISIITVFSSIDLINFKNEYYDIFHINSSFIDENGNKLKYQYIVINIDGEDDILVTDANGIINFNKQLSLGIHTLKIINPITKEEIIKTITVKHLTTSSTLNNPTSPTKPVYKTTLTLKKVKVKKSAKKLIIQATLKINGKALKGKVIKFKFNKKTYKARTNAKGVAKITVKKSVLKKLKAGKKVKYQVTYGKITKKVTVKVKK